jgi:hypothetical protein
MGGPLLDLLTSQISAKRHGVNTYLRVGNVNFTHRARSSVVQTSNLDRGESWLLDRQMGWGSHMPNCCRQHIF